MNVGESIKYALDHFGRQEFEAATLHACLAVDGTAKKLYPELKNKNRERFERMVRDHIRVLTAFASPGINLETTMFPVRIEEGGKREPLDAASIIYKVHRCTHGHGDELPNGFEFVPTDGDHITLNVNIESGTVALPTTTVLGLVAVAFLSPVNVDQQIPMAFHVWQPLIADDGRRDTVWLPVHQWWGRLDDFLCILDLFPRAQTTLEFQPEHYDSHS